MRRTVDHVLAVLPIEEAYFPEHGIPATYVGHPFFDAVQERQLDQLLMDRFATCTAGGNRLVAVLPGSRGHEVQQNWPMMIESIRRLHHQHREVRFLVACYRDRQCLWCRQMLTAEDRSLPIEFFVDRTSEVIEASHCAMMVSGSVSLELMARRTPAAVIYRVGRFLHSVAKMMVKLDSITLPNLMNGRRVFPELVSVGAPEPGIDFLTGSVDAFLRDDFYYRRVLQTLDQLSQRYAKPGASARAAQWVSRAIGGSARPVVHAAGRRSAAKAA
jgi:lipid-A-disaccharide synthase